MKYSINIKWVNTLQTKVNDLSTMVSVKIIKWHLGAWLTYVAIDFLSAVVFDSPQIMWWYAISNLAFAISLFYGVFFIFFLSWEEDRYNPLCLVTLLLYLILLTSLKILITKGVGQMGYSIHQYFIVEFWRLLYFGLLASGFWFVVLGLIRKNQQLKTKEEVLKARLDLTKSKLNPHFLFNSLNAVRGALFHKDKEVADWVVDLAELLKHGIIPTHGTLSEEIKIVENYISLEKRRFKGQCHIKIQNTVDMNKATELMMPRMAILTIVENLFKHGEMMDRNHPARLRLSLEQNKKENMEGLYFKLLIENRVKSSSRTSLGVGLSSIEEIFGFYFSDSYELITQYENNIFDLYLSIKYDG
ncbi:hypothetical protein GCM10028791_25950 [Echinicola sediminis]